MFLLIYITLNIKTLLL